MPVITVRLEVSNPERLRDLSDEQPSNMRCIVTTFEVLNPERSASLRFVKPRNIQDKSSDQEFTCFFTTTDVMLSFFSNQPYDPSPPDASPGSGSIVRQPPASIIHWQVPEVVQLTIGSSEPLDCRAKPPSPASASPSEVKSSSAGAKPSSKPPIARESSAESASPPPSASWEEAVSSGDPPPRFPELAPCRASAGRTTPPGRRPETT